MKIFVLSRKNTILYLIMFVSIAMLIFIGRNTQRGASTRAAKRVNFAPEANFLSFF